MKKDAKPKKGNLLEIEDLRICLEEAEETLAAIRRGEVDGLVVSGPKEDRVFTLKGAERSYRFFVEAMNEGAVTLAFDGTILYCNDRFAEMVAVPHRKIIGGSIYQFISIPNDAFEAALQRGKTERSHAEVLLQGAKNERITVSISFNPMQEDEVPGICMVVTDLTEHMRKDEVLKESEERLRDLSSKLLTAHEEERKRISHEIHDALGSSLGALKFMADGLLKQFGKNEILDNMMRSIQRTTEETRRIQAALHPPLLDDLGILATIHWFSREFQKTYSGIRIEAQIGIEEGHIPAPLKTTIYRIAQEALNNVAKHSKAELIQFCLRKTDRIELLIRDNGDGFDLSEKLSLDGSKRGIGLSSMKERTELSGGCFSIESAKGKGTFIQASWPLK